jgi:hypothetical protein
MKQVSIAVLLFCIFTSVWAEPNPAKIKELMEAVGLLDMWSQQMELGKKQNKEMGEKMLSQILLKLNPNEDFKNRFSGAFNNYIKKLEAPWSAQEIVDVWASYYGPHFTDDELDKLIAFYTSDLGRKDVMVTKQVMVQFSTHFQEKGKPIFEKATKEYLEEMQIIAKECNCRKNSAMTKQPSPTR